jgi:hypothetical protein
MKGFDPEFPHNMENFRRANKFNKPFNNQTIMKKDFFIRIGFQSVSFMGARDYVKPVSSHEAVFVGSTNFPKIQRYKKKPKFHKER